MRKNRRFRFVLALDLAILVLVLLSVMFPADKETVSDYSMETDDAEKLLYITNEEKTELKYTALNENIKKLILYFDVETEENDTEKSLLGNGTILYTVKKESGEILYGGSISADRIVHEKSRGALTGTGLPIVLDEEPGETIMISLQGEAIPEDRKICLLGNGSQDGRLVAAKHGEEYLGFPLYQIKTGARDWPWTWDLLLALFLLLGLTVLMAEEKKNAACEGKDKIKSE